MESCDVLIVGGGPAGSSLAWKLRNSGLDVLILDKSQFPRDKVCAGWIAPAVFKALEIDINEYGQKRTLQPITGFLTSLMNGDAVETRYKEVVSYSIRRSEFDHYLLQRSGARLRLGEPLKTLERAGSHWIVNGSIKAPLIVGAGGHFCPVVRMINEKNHPPLTPLPSREGKSQHPSPPVGEGQGEGGIVVAQEMEFRMGDGEKEECKVRGDTPELYFCEDLKGYGWCVRKGDFLNIGLGRLGTKGISSEVSAFFDLLKRKGRIPQSIKTGFKGHAYLLYGSRKDIVEDGALVIGDAAGLAYPKSGEGIFPAIESGFIAADVILEAKGDYKKECLMPYPSLLAERLGNPKKSNDGLLPEELRLFLARRFMASKWFTRQILLNRWFLHV